MSAGSLCGVSQEDQPLPFCPVSLNMQAGADFLQTDEAKQVR